MEQDDAVTFGAVVLREKLVLTSEGDGFRRRVFVPVDRLSELELTTAPLVIDGQVFETAGGGSILSVTKVSVRWWASDEVITSVDYSYPPQVAAEVFTIINLALHNPGSSYLVPAPPRPTATPALAGMILADPDAGCYEQRRDNFGNTWLTEYRIPKIGERYIDAGYPCTVLSRVFAGHHVIVGGPL